MQFCIGFKYFVHFAQVTYMRFKIFYSFKHVVRTLREKFCYHRFGIFTSIFYCRKNTVMARKVFRSFNIFKFCIVNFAERTNLFIYINSVLVYHLSIFKFICCSVRFKRLNKHLKVHMVICTKCTKFETCAKLHRLQI